MTLTSADAPRTPLLLLLSLAAGCTDAMAFLKAGVFPANMTGNSVVLAISLARWNVSMLTLSGLALVGFSLGAAGGAWLLRDAPHAWSRRTSLGLFAAAGLVAASTILALCAPTLVPLIVVLAATAMGLQSASVQWLGIPGVATVFMTGTLTTAVTRLVGRHTASGARLPGGTFLCYLAGAFLGGLQSFPSCTAIGGLPTLLLAGVALAAWRATRG